MQTDLGIELMRLCHVPGAWAHYWRKNPAMSLWFPTHKPPRIPDPWMDGDLWFSVNAVSADNPRGAAHRVQKAHVQRVQVIYCDFDAGDTNMPLQPSIIVNSGRGQHCYWLLDEPIDAATAAPLQRSWVRVLGADRAASDLARVLRVPGTCNTKYGTPLPVTVLQWEPGRRYTAAHLQRIVSEKSSPVKDVGAKRNLPAPAREGGSTGIVARILRSRQGDEFARLYSGQHTYPSASEADAALCRLIAWWLGGDTAEMLAIWKSSGLWREERCNDDYVQRTLQHGLSGNRNLQHIR